MLLFNNNDTKESYIKPISRGHLLYLENRGIISRDYYHALLIGDYGILKENKLEINGTPFCVNCILGQSDDQIFDIIGTNSLYNLQPEKKTAFSVLYGDDYLFFKPNDEKIYYWSISLDEEILLADTYNDFLSMIDFINT